MTDIQSFHVCIEGQVQGVGFLAFSGDEKSVKLMLEKCRYGPPLATVTNLDDQPCAPPDTSFHQLTTA
jgi:acylphosphatase